MEKKFENKIISEKRPEIIKLDLKDMKLISALSVNARFSPSFLGKLIGASKDSVRYRIKGLKEKGIYLNPVLIVNPYALGLQYHSIYFKFNNLSSDEEDKLIKEIVEHEFIIWCGVVGGEWDIGVHLFSKDDKHFNEIFKELKEFFGERLVNSMHLVNYEMPKYENIPTLLRKQVGLSLDELKRDTSFQKFFEMGKGKIASSSDRVAEIDKLDSKILERLAKGPDVSVAILADDLKVSFDTVKNRIISLIEQKVILAFRPLYNISSLGFFSYVIFLESKIGKSEVFEKYLNGYPYSGYVMKTFGNWDWQLYIATRDPYEFYAVLRDLRSEFSDRIRNYGSVGVVQDFKFDFTPRGVVEHINNLAK